MVFGIVCHVRKDDVALIGFWVIWRFGWLGLVCAFSFQILQVLRGEYVNVARDVLLLESLDQNVGKLFEKQFITCFESDILDLL